MTLPATFGFAVASCSSIKGLVALLLQKLDEEWGGPLAEWLLTDSSVTSAPTGYQSSNNPEDWLLTPKEKLQVRFLWHLT